MRRLLAPRFFVITALFAFSAQADTIFVDADATGAGNGSSWTDAYTTVNAAITAAANFDEVWVKGGTYAGQVVMKDFVDLYGGFAGTESLLTERVLGANPTILDGSALMGLDTATVAGQGAIIDGFTITGNVRGINVWGGAMTIRHCIVGPNASVGIDATEMHSVTIDSCLIVENATGIKTGLDMVLRIRNSTVTNNTTNVDINADTNPIEVTNSIVWPGELVSLLEMGVTVDIEHSIIESTYQPVLNVIGPDVLMVAPVFADDGNGDYRLRPDSRGVDEGTLTGTVDTDIAGNGRTLGAATDMGAFEYDPSGDFDGDGLLDADEGLSDPDTDGLPNLADLDSDNDNVLDQYEGLFDTDGDTTPDFIDTDRDDNGIDDIDDAFIVYVDKAQTSNPRDGRSWATAFRRVQDGIDLAGPAGEDVGGGHVWIAKGLYKEFRTFIRNNVNTGSLKLLDRVSLFGGFDGDEESFSERVLEFDSTIIDGSISRDGLPAYQVVRGAKFTKLDGLTIRGGRADLFIDGDIGAGLECPPGTWTDINACFFYDNIADYEGGGLYFSGGNPTITNSIFVQNAAMNGGTIRMGQSPIEGSDGITLTPQLNIANCVFYNNSTLPPDDREGSVVLSFGPTVLFRNTILLNNSDLAVASVNGAAFLYANCSIEPGVTYGYSQGGGSDLGGNIDDDPEFLDASNSDFRITVESPAYDVGTAVNTPTTDIIGQERPRGAAHEMGAYEVGDGQDLDDDGVPDYLEGAGDPDNDNEPNYLDEDSDNDGLDDGDEVNVYMTNPIVVDTDGDNLSDGDEVLVHETNPNESDSDFDNIDDDVEIFTYETDPNEADSDGDNLDDDDELFVHETNPNEPDSDFDDMPDDFEVLNSLNPNVNDADGNEDEDPFTNLEEFERGSDPNDPNSPYRNLFVDDDGDDDTGDGSEGNPWQTIAKAMSEAALDAAEDNFVTIHLAAGIYEELVTFVEFVGIEGAGPSSVIRHFDGNDPIHNVIVAARDTELRDLTVEIPVAVGDDSTLLRIDNASMIVDGVVFNGRSNLDSTGVLIARSGSSDSIITNCIFRNLENGVHAVNSGVRIARNTFEFINQGNAIFIGFAQGAKGDEPAVAPGLGDGLDVAQTGFNRFRNIDGFFINIDEVVPVTAFAEYNDWGTDDPEEIAAGISLPDVKGPGAPEVDFEPFLKTRLAISTVIVPLFVEGETDTNGKPVPVAAAASPSVTMSPSIGAGERDSGTGVFLFPNVPSGSYTAEGAANNHDGNQIGINVNDGGSIVAPMTLVNNGPPIDPEDVNGDGMTNAIDIQFTILAVLGENTGINGDVNNDGATNSIDIQLVINSVLGL